MFYSLLMIVAVGAAIYLRKKWQKLPESERNSFAKKGLLWGTVAVVLVLVATGRAHWLMGVLAGLLALAGRVAQFAQYMPIFKKIFGDDAIASPSAPTNGKMTKQEAADLLGVEVTANHDEVRLAHKKLMQKIHPDRGGSDALAKQINQAKKTLLS